MIGLIKLYFLYPRLFNLSFTKDSSLSVFCPSVLSYIFHLRTPAKWRSRNQPRHYLLCLEFIPVLPHQVKGRHICFLRLLHYCLLLPSFVHPLKPNLRFITRNRGFHLLLKLRVSYGAFTNDKSSYHKLILTLCLSPNLIWYTFIRSLSLYLEILG